MKTGNHKKISCFFAPFCIFEKRQHYAVQRRLKDISENLRLFRLVYNVHFAFFSFAGIRRNISVALAKFFLAALKVSGKFFAGTQQSKPRMTDSKRTARKPPLFKSKYRPVSQISLHAPSATLGRILVGECLPQTMPVKSGKFFLPGTVAKRRRN